MPPSFGRNYIERLRGGAIRFETAYGGFLFIPPAPTAFISISLVIFELNRFNSLCEIEHLIPVT